MSRWVSTKVPTAEESATRCGVEPAKKAPQRRAALPLGADILQSSTVHPRVLGIDIGGANLKFSFGRQVACDRFPMWRESERLSTRLLATVAQLAERPEAIAITMTGELADCFATRRAGVRHILSHCADAFPLQRIRVYTVDGNWLAAEAACQRPWDVAASNWHALASWLASAWPQSLPAIDLIVDIGSTTVDIIPLGDGQVATTARTDRQRMQAGQLVYTGCERTPVCSIVKTIEVEGQSCPVMAERFADSLDAYLVLGQAGEQRENFDTADGRPRTRVHALARLARMVGEDTETLPIGEIESLAEQIVTTQTQAIIHSMHRNVAHAETSRPTIVCTGHGQHLVDRLKMGFGRPAEWIDLSACLGTAASRNASAIAVARLLELESQA